MATIQDVLDFSAHHRIEDEEIRNLFKEAQNLLSLEKISHDKLLTDLQNEINDHARVADELIASLEEGSSTAKELARVRILLNQRDAELANALNRAEDDTVVLIRKMITDHVDMLLCTTEMTRRIEEMVKATIEDYDFDDAAKDKLQEAVDDLRIEVKWR